MQAFRNILSVLDGMRDDQPVLARAEQLARECGAKLRLVDVVSMAAWPVRLAISDYDHVLELLRHEKEVRLEQYAEGLRERGIEVSTGVLVGRGSQEIIREVLRNQHDLVIQDVKGRTSRRRGFFGTTSQRLLRQCPCAVWLVHPDHPLTSETILAAVDATPHDADHDRLNREILQVSSEISASQSGCLHVIHVWDLYGESVLKEHMNAEEHQALLTSTEASVFKSFQMLLERFDMQLRDANVHLLRGDPATEITRFVRRRKVDLLVLGTVARTGIAGLLLGNTAEAILDLVECSVLALKPVLFVTPVKPEEAAAEAKPVSAG